MRRTATSAAVFALIVLAVVGTLSDVPPFVCSMRAMAGAGIVYLLVTVAGRVAISILASVIRAGPPPRAQVKDQTSGHTD